MLGEDNSIRPGVAFTLSRLKAEGHEVWAWSGDTRRAELLDACGLLELLHGVTIKPTSNYRGRARELCGDHEPQFVVDDHPQVVRMFGGLQLPSYYGADHPDQMFGWAAGAIEVHVLAGRENCEDDLWMYTAGTEGELWAKRIRDNCVSDIVVHKVRSGGDGCTR